MSNKRAALETAERKAREWGRRLSSDLPNGWGFILFLASLGRDGAGTYLSTIERDDSIRLIKEWIVQVSPGGNLDAPRFVDRTQKECWCCETKTDLLIIEGPMRSLALCRKCWNSKGDGNGTDA